MEAANRRSPAARRAAMGLLAALALVAALRITELTRRDFAAPQSPSSKEPTAALVTPASAETRPLSDQDVALLAMACPQSLESMPPELRAAMSRIAPPHRLLAAREADENWLVDPSAWRGLEDDEPAAEATPTEPTAPAEPPAVTEEPAAPTPLALPPVEAPPAAPAEPPPAAVDLPPAVAPATDPPATEVSPPSTDETAVAEPAAAPPEDWLPKIEPPSAATPAIEITPPPAAPLKVIDVEPAPPTVPLAAPPTPAPPAAEAEPLLDLPLDAPQPRPQPEPPITPAAPPSAPPNFGPPVVVPPAAQPPAAQPPVAEPPAAQPPAVGSPGELLLPLFDSPNTTPPRPELTQPELLPRPTAPPPPSLFAPPSEPVDPPARAEPPTTAPHSTRSAPLTPAEQKKADESHADLFAKNCYPSARQCGECHKKQYEEWSLSSHAYAFVSPMFQKFEQKITDLSQGTVGYFCMRCHSPTATSMNLPRDTPIWEMPEVAREGVTCIACHRVNEYYGKSNGERRIVPGDIHAPVYGGIGGDGVAKAIANKDTYKVKTSPDEKGAGQAIHNEGRFFAQLSQAEFCTSCHQVAVHPGIKLEVVWEQYRASPACKKGVTCQHCHMGTIPGVASPYEVGSIAEVGGKSVNENRKHANHVFYGPGYSIAHPGVFPFHKDAGRWRIDEWLAFDWRAGWGTDDFEDAVADGQINACFPEVWKEADDRYDAREIVEDNIARLGEKRKLRREVMENGTKVAGPFFRKAPSRDRDLVFDYVVTNINEGHNLLTASLGAQPQLWANVVLIGPDGQRLWETGYTDCYGDLADIHSVEVRNGRLPFDSQLFNLQTMFLITGATGTDREFPLPVNVSVDQVPHLRPGALPITVLNHPPLIRMESRSLAPLGSKRVKYRVDKRLLKQPGRYRLSFRMRSRTEPIYFMRFCDATVEMQRAMNEGVLDVHPYSVEFWVK